MLLRKWSIAIKKNIGKNPVFSCWVWWSSLRKKKNVEKELKISSLLVKDCAMSLESLLPIRHHSLGKKRPLLPFLHFTFCPYPLPMMRLAALVKSATQSPITRKGCEVYESDYRPIFPEIRSLSPGSSGPHGASQAWPQTRVVFSPLSLLIAVKQRLCLRVK